MSKEHSHALILLSLVAVIALVGLILVGSGSLSGKPVVDYLAQRTALMPQPTVVAPVPSCSDSDEGKNYGVKGFVEGYSVNALTNYKVYDKCQGSSTLLEKYCTKNNQYETDVKYCDKGQVCKDGACVGTPVPAQTATPTTVQQIPTLQPPVATVTPTPPVQVPKQPVAPVVTTPAAQTPAPQPIGNTVKLASVKCGVQNVYADVGQSNNVWNGNIQGSLYYSKNSFNNLAICSIGYVVGNVVIYSSSNSNANNAAYKADCKNNGQGGYTCGQGVLIGYSQTNLV